MKSKEVYSIKYMKKIWRVLLMATVIASGCTDIIETEERDSSAILVVEGEINNADEAYIIKISTTTSLAGEGENELGRGAEVAIRNESGEEVQLTEIEPGGSYSTLNNGFKGEIGQSYQLYIKLANGEEYESSFEEIRPSVELLDVFAEVRSEPSNDIFGEKFFHDLSIEVNNNPDLTQFYSVDVTGIAEVSIIYDEIITLGDNPCIPQNIRPLVCYAIRDSIVNDVIIGTNSGAAGASFIQDIFSIPADFELRYLAQVRTNTISELAYQYLQDIKTQLEKEGSIFDAPFPALVGNVKNIRSGNRAQGYFFASSISENQVCFDRSVLNFEFFVPLVCAIRGPDNCVEFWDPAVFEIPEGFQLCL